VNGKKDAGVQLPADIASLSDVQLAKLRDDAHTEFDAQYESETPDLTRVTELADIIEAVGAENGQREAAAAQLQSDLEAQRSRVRPPEAEAPAEVTEAPAEVVETPVPVGAAATTQPRPQSPNSATQTLLAGGGQIQAARKLNPTISEIAARAPKLTGPRRESVLVASADIPGVPMASNLADMDALVAAMHARARVLPVTRLGTDATWHPVAQLQLDHRYTLDRNSSMEEINEVLIAATDPDAMVAAGGWCSPSEISYDFYNIVCEDGMVDLPSAGINRGGMRWPVSPSYGDFLTNTNNFFSWNETQDIAALTGTGQSGTKACARVPCPSFLEGRLACDGFCLTMGNLMNDAWPELVANHTRLLFAGHAHRMNLLRIQAMLAQSTSTGITGLGVAGNGVVAPVLGALELQAIDYRSKFAMCADAVLEVILPQWLRGAMRSDLRKRTGVDLLEVADARLMNMFDLINVRVQWVGDWQVRTAGYPGNSTFLTSWPTTVSFMLYAAGTFLLGRGLQLNLGVIRDSVLNETNDFTAEWMEECWMLMKIGHESRYGTINICPDGTTGAADLTACGL
jgi:hypothetical protein